MSENRSTLAIFTSILTLIGIIILIINVEIGLTIIFVAILLLAGYYIRNRLESVGIESFALGSVFVWFGFFTAAFPLIAFAWGFLTSSTQFILFSIGVFLILFGFTFEIFDLNLKFVNLLRSLKKNLDEVLEILRRRVFRSVWTVIAISSLTVAVITSISSSFSEFFPNLFGFRYGVALEFVIIALLSFLIEFRQIVYIVLTYLVKFLLLILISLWARLKQLPSLLVDFTVFLKSIGISILEFVWSFLSYLKLNPFLTGFGFSLLFGIMGIVRQDQLLQSAAIILLLIAMINLLHLRQDSIANRVAGIQQSAYRRSFTLRNIISSEHTGNCPSCQVTVTPGRKYCQNCGNFIPACLVCRNTMYAGDEILRCSNCEYAGHREHLERWLSIRPTCPNCRTEWN